METVTDPRARTNFIFASINLIESKLARVKKYIVDTYHVNGRLEPDEQHAIRVVDSRIRALHRSFLIQTRPDTDRDRQLAEAELRMAHPDNGDLFRWRMRNHAFGRIGCNGCEYDYGQDTGLGIPRKEIVSQVCPSCRRGVVHSLGVESATEATEGILGFFEGVGRPLGPQEALGVAQEAQRGIFEGTGATLMICEACGKWELRP